MRWVPIFLVLAALSATSPSARAQGNPQPAGDPHGKNGEAPAPEPPTSKSDPATGDPAVNQPKHTNRLIHETSPYLRQHAHNPVDWYPWGPEAIERSRKEDKPIFLSIGYSACHWCHVMEHESFEDEETGNLLNENFVSIKVDREERPDLDEIYMSAVQMMTGSGGWPMSVFLTPDLKPFYGGTYFPPEDRWGRPGFKSVLRRIIEVFKGQRPEVERSARGLTEMIAGHAGIPGLPGDVDLALLQEACAILKRQFDSKFGGFGHAPKFPPSMELNLLLRRARVTKDAEMTRIVEVTLDRMARGGMYDQIGGGFCRYSTDEKWLVPHFEKMLYDNALLSRTYLAAYQATGKPFYARIARETFEYILRDMTHPRGGFYSSEDADSEGVEGKFYVWKPAEVLAVLGPEDGELFCAFYDITEHGNWEETSIPNVPVPLEEFAKTRGLDASALQDRLEAACARMLAVRAKRIRPGLDDKILTAWNALMIQSMVQGAQILGERRYLDAAKAAGTFVRENLRKGDRLLVTWRDGTAKLNAYLDDYAFLTAAYLDLYEATFDLAWLEEARRLAALTHEHFLDEKEGGYFFVSDDHEALIVRTKAPYDGVIPSGNSEYARNLLRLSVLTGETALRDRAAELIRKFKGPMEGSPRGFANMLCVVDFLLGSPKEIAIVGSPADPGTAELLVEVHRAYLPNKVIAGFDPAAASAKGIGAKIPLLDGKGLIDGKPAAYVCENYTCRKPVHRAEDLRALLRE